MRLQEFIMALPDLWDGDGQHALLPRDRRFRDLLEETGGMGTENKLAVLNLAARHLEQDEIYLEVGAFRGTSIVAASLDNDVTFYTIDDFSQFGGPVEACRELIQARGNGRIELLDRDAWDVLRDPPFAARVGVYFYDGPHEFWHQWRALDLVQPLLADQALVIVDDASWSHVHAANDAFLATHPRFERLRLFGSDQVNGDKWWNGVDVIAYRQTGPIAATPGTRRRYLRSLLRHGIVGRQVGRVSKAATRASKAVRHPVSAMASLRQR